MGFQLGLKKATWTYAVRLFSRKQYGFYFSPGWNLSSCNHNNISARAQIRHVITPLDYELNSVRRKMEQQTDAIVEAKEVFWNDPTHLELCWWLEEVWELWMPGWLSDSYRLILLSQSSWKKKTHESFSRWSFLSPVESRWCWLFSAYQLGL